MWLCSNIAHVVQFPLNLMFGYALERDRILFLLDRETSHHDTGHLHIPYVSRSITQGKFITMHTPASIVGPSISISRPQNDLGNHFHFEYVIVWD
jgi:hypothetical protein